VDRDKAKLEGNKIAGQQKEGKIWHPLTSLTIVQLVIKFNICNQSEIKEL
jgi:hypothetical protein